MKKVLCLCLAFLLCFMTAGYAAEEATTTDTAAESGAEVFGRVEEDYLNDVIGFGFKLGDWHFCTDEEIDALNTISKAVLTEDYAKMVEQLDTFYIMMAIASDGTNINISLKNLGNTAVLYNAMGMETIVKSSVEATLSMMQMAGYQNVAVEYVKTPIDGQEYDGMKATFELQNRAMCAKMVMLIRDRYLVTFTITGLEEDKVNDAFQRLYHLN